MEFEKRQWMNLITRTSNITSEKTIKYLKHSKKKKGNDLE